MIIQTRRTYDFIEIKVDEIKTTIFKSDIKEINDTIENLLQVVDELKTLKERQKNRTMKQTAVEWLVNELKNNHGIDLKLYNEFDKAKEMEKKQRKKDFVNGYKSRAKESNLIFDETSEMYAIKLFNETFKSE
jgi:hypothetical protein